MYLGDGREVSEPRRRFHAMKTARGQKAKPKPKAMKDVKAVVDRRKLSALSGLLLDVPVDAYEHRVQQLKAMLFEENQKNTPKLSKHKHGGGRFLPTMSPQASEFKKELIGLALYEAKYIQQASLLTKSKAYGELCSAAELETMIAFPPHMHADAARRGCKLGYRLYHNEFLGLINAERHDVAESKAVNRLVLTCLTTAASASGLERRMQKSLETRSQLQMERVPCDHFGHCVMAQTGYALDCFLDELSKVDPALVKRPEDACYLRFMARTIFDEDGREQVCALYDTKHSSVNDNAKALQRFLSERTARLGLKRCAAALTAPDRIRALYTGLIGSIAANSLIAAYVVRCETAAPSKVDAYTQILQADYERAKLCINMVTLPGCLKSLGPGASLDKRLLVLNAFSRIVERGQEPSSASSSPSQPSLLFSELRPRTIHIVNNIVSSIKARHNEADGVSDRPIREGSEYSFNHFNDMSTYAISKVVTEIVETLGIDLD